MTRQSYQIFWILVIRVHELWPGLPPLVLLKNVDDKLDE